MALLAGIDEAGYGPVLGPLIVSGVAFRVPDEQLGACLWQTLKQSCTDKLEHRGHRLVIADSKKLYRSRSSLAPLERAALVMLAVAGHRPGSWRALLEDLAPRAGDALNGCRWYADADVALPSSKGVGDIPTRANAVRLDCREHDVELRGVFSEPLLAGQYNGLVERTRNKAVVLLGLALRVVDRILRCAPESRVRLYVDRLGGRRHYREPLLTGFPEYDLQIVEETPWRSAYRLTGVSRVFEVEFVTRGETHHFPVALASVYSKYLRELYMCVFNEYWSRRLPGLRPTAGYYSDAQRWIREATPALDRLAVDLRTLVRQR